MQEWAKAELWQVQNNSEFRKPPQIIFIAYVSNQSSLQLCRHHLPELFGRKEESLVVRDHSQAICSSVSYSVAVAIFSVHFNAILTEGVATTVWSLMNTACSLADFLLTLYSSSGSAFWLVYHMNWYGDIAMS